MSNYNSGFFNSLNNDRMYDAEDMNTFLEGLISDGVFAGVDSELQVVADGTEPYDVVVRPGKALVNNHWYKQDTGHSRNLTLSDPNPASQRYDAVVLRFDSSARNVDLAIITGSDPNVKPQPVRTGEIYDLVLAYVKVIANTSAISNADIEDTRTNTELCGFVHGLVDQVDTTTLFNQYRFAYAKAISELDNWSEDMQLRFQAWLSTLTEQLDVSGYIEPEVRTYYAVPDTENIPIHTAVYFLPPGNRAASDIIDVYVNGKLLTPQQYYREWVELPLQGYTHGIYIYFSTNLLRTARIDIVIKKSQLGIAPSVFVNTNHSEVEPGLVLPIQDLPGSFTPDYSNDGGN